MTASSSQQPAADQSDNGRVGWGGVAPHVRMSCQQPRAAACFALARPGLTRRGAALDFSGLGRPAGNLPNHAFVFVWTQIFFCPPAGPTPRSSARRPRTTTGHEDARAPVPIAIVSSATATARRDSSESFLSICVSAAVNDSFSRRDLTVIPVR